MPKNYLGILTALSLIISSSAALAKFEFQKGDSVCLIGNSLPDRFNHDGWFEAVLQSELKGQEVRFRNLGFTGDTVKERPRNSGFPSPENYLKICEADVIFAFFGYNESFKGEKGLESFMNDLSGMIDNYTKLKPNGKSAPRFVLFSPIAHEDLKSPNLPDGKANNVRLEQYTAAIKAVAEKKGVTFVDLFSPSKALYSKSK